MTEITVPAGHCLSVGARDVGSRLHAYAAHAGLSEPLPQSPRSILGVKFRVPGSNLSSRLLKNLNVLVSERRKFL